MSIGPHIIRLRTAKGWSLSELARQAGVTKSLVSRLENGVTVNSKIETLKAIASALDIDTSELLEIEQFALPIGIVRAYHAIREAKNGADYVASLIDLEKAVKAILEGNESEADP